MARLIHLNGPSRVGKTTLAHLYTDDHPGTLCLDIDLLTGLIGGWRDDFYAALNTARAHALTIATDHLLDGHDVVVPQLVTKTSEAARFAEAADDADAEYVEVVLTVSTDENSERVAATTPTHDVARHIQQALESGDLMMDVRDSLNDYLPHRTDTHLLDTTGLTPDRVYEKLRAVLGA